MYDDVREECSKTYARPTKVVEEILKTLDDNERQMVNEDSWKRTGARKKEILHLYLKDSPETLDKIGKYLS